MHDWVITYFREQTLIKEARMKRKHSSRVDRCPASRTLSWYSWRNGILGEPLMTIVYFGQCETWVTVALVQFVLTSAPKCCHWPTCSITAAKTHQTIIYKSNISKIPQILGCFRIWSYLENRLESSKYCSLKLFNLTFLSALYLLSPILITQ